MEPLFGMLNEEKHFTNTNLEAQTSPVSCAINTALGVTRYISNSPQHLQEYRCSRIPNGRTRVRQWHWMHSNYGVLIGVMPAVNLLTIIHHGWRAPMNIQHVSELHYVHPTHTNPQAAKNWNSRWSTMTYLRSSILVDTLYDLLR